MDYLKYDNCFAPASDWVVDRYTAMQQALNATDRDIVFSICEWGVADPWIWAPEVGGHRGLPLLCPAVAARQGGDRAYLGPPQM